jgi:hypothetical protein
VRAARGSRIIYAERNLNTVSNRFTTLFTAFKYEGMCVLVQGGYFLKAVNIFYGSKVKQSKYIL